MGKNEAAAPLRVDLNIRVSGQEQAIKGLSLEAQQEDLEEYARERGWVIVGIYIDAAKTARKRLGNHDTDPEGMLRKKFVQEQLALAGIETTEAVLNMIEGAVWEINTENQKALVQMKEIVTGGV